jgi:putative sigma-54 modulation protein
VVLLVEKFRHIAEININGDRLTINGKEETNDMYSAIDMVLDKLEKQIKKNKQKIRERRPGVKAKNIALMEADINLPEEELVREVKVKNIEYKPMDVEEAVLQMDLLSNSFLVFTNARSDRVNVLYRRKDGHYGLIQPNG